MITCKLAVLAALAWVFKLASGQKLLFVLALDVNTLTLLGVPQQQAERAGMLFREHHNQSLLELSALWGDDKSYGVAVRQRQDDLSQVLAAISKPIARRMLALISRCSRDCNYH